MPTTKDYTNKPLTENGITPFFVQEVEAGGKIYRNMRSYYNPQWSISKEFQLWYNEDCLKDPLQEWCNLPDDVLKMEAIIHDKNTGKWYSCESIEKSADRSNWIEYTKEVKDNGYLAPLSDEDYKKSKKKDKGQSDGKKKSKEQRKKTQRGKPRLEHDYEKSGWIKAEWADNAFFRLYSKLMESIFGKGTDTKKRTLGFTLIGLAIGKVMSDKNK